MHVNVALLWTVLAVTMNSCSEGCSPHEDYIAPVGGSKTLQHLATTTSLNTTRVGNAIMFTPRSEL